MIQEIVYFFMRRIKFYGVAGHSRPIPSYVVLCLTDIVLYEQIAVSNFSRHFQAQ
jgi:hypothetical protein